MFRKSWEVQPGMGEAILAGIGHDVRKYRELRRELPSIQKMMFLARIHEQSAEILQSREDAKNAQRQLEAAGAICSLLDEVRRFEGRKYLGKNDPHFRFVLEVLEAGDGFVGWRESGPAGGDEAKGEREILVKGDVREGESGGIGLVASVPDLGGKLVADFPGEESFWPQLRKGVHVDGLVSPVSGDPQVDLQILMKTG